MIDAAALADVEALLRRATAAEILPRWRRLGADVVRTKSGPLDLVTDADEAAERMITAGLEARFPGCLVVGEEASSTQPALLDALAGADLAFVVDPVDGTQNFAAGLPLFACMAAAIRRGEIIAAWIHDPLGRDTAIALRGEGAWISAEDGTRRLLRVAAPVPVSRMVAAVSWGFMPEPLKTRVTGRLPRLAATVGLRCAAHEYRLVAGGHAHALVYNKLMPWDHAPGWLLHREAGGYSAHFDGSAYGPQRRSGGLLVTPDRESWEALHAALLGEESAA